MFKKAIEINPKAEDVCSELAWFYQKRNKYTQNKKVMEIIRKEDRCRKIMRYNYQKLRHIVLKRGIKLVCVQYPMCSLESLRMMFDSVEGVTFVDNESIFKEALRNGEYKDYFLDRINDDFGHCTPKGNRLLANNIADVILKEYFNK